MFCTRSAATFMCAPCACESRDLTRLTIVYGTVRFEWILPTAQSAAPSTLLIRESIDRGARNERASACEVAVRSRSLGVRCASIRPPSSFPSFGVSSMATAVKLNVPPQGEKITIKDGKLSVPDQPIIPFIEGDGTGPDIWRAAVRVLDAAV